MLAGFSERAKKLSVFKLLNHLYNAALCLHEQRIAII